MYLLKIKPENTYYKTHQKVCNIHPKALWSIVENGCYVLSPKGNKDQEVNYHFNNGDEVYFAVRFNGIKRNGNFEIPCNEGEVITKVTSAFRGAVDIVELDIEKEQTIYMKEKNHRFYPWFITAKALVKNKDKFVNLIETGIGRSKRLGFGMIIT